MEKRSTYFLGFVIGVLSMVIFAALYFKLGRALWHPAVVAIPFFTAFCLYKTIFPGNPKDKE